MQKRNWIIICLLLSGVLLNSAHAQFQGRVYELFQDAKVTDSGALLRSPWCGGINSTQINLADLNQDGKPDLVLFDHINNRVMTFLYTGSSGQVHYTYNPLYEGNFPALMSYLILKDYNCDGIPDLFHKGITGVSVFKGYYQNNQLKFTFYKNLFYPGAFGPVNVFVQPDDIPAITDVDKDGDLDVVSFNVNGTYLEYARNMRVEQSLPCDSMVMELVDACYGKFYQGLWRSVNMGISCKGSVPNGKKKKRHTGNCFVLLDIEGDNDLDFLGGNISFQDVQLLYNGGSSSNAVYTAEDTLYQSAGHQLHMPNWAAPFHLDIDQDGDSDLLFTPHMDNNSSANYHCMSWYKNQGSDAAPNFVFQHDSLLIPDMVDVGSYSAPALFDYDKDGRKDLFIGNEGYLVNASGQSRTQLAYYKNTSTPGQVSFERVTLDFLGLSTYNYKGLFPTFGDMTGDGIDDLVIGNPQGYISVFKNYATSNTVPPNFSFFTDSIPGITVGAYSMPLVYDFNLDGRTDLLVGNQAGYLYYYQDTSTTSMKKLSLQTISLGNFKAGDVNNIYGYCAPFIGKMDNTGKEFLLIGNIDGTIARYDTFINNMGSFVRIDSNYSLVQTLNRSVVVVDDLDNNGKYDMLIGHRTGGLIYLRQVKDVLLDVREPSELSGVQLYPNPVQQQLYLEASDRYPAKTCLWRIQNITGQLVQQHNSRGIPLSVDVSHLSPGWYSLQLVIEGKSRHLPFIKF